MDVPPTACTVHSLQLDTDKVTTEVEVDLNRVTRITSSEELSRTLQVRALVGVGLKRGGSGGLRLH